MKLSSVQIENFRAIEKLDLPLDPQLTVFHGDNAHGKTSVLAAIAVGLGAVPQLLPDVSGIGFLKNDRREEESARVSLTTTDEVSWERTSGPIRRTERASKKGRSKEPLRPPLKDLKQWLENNVLEHCEASVDLPIVAFYNTERAVPNLIGRKGFPKMSPSRYSALSGALSAKTNFRELFEWFYWKANEESRTQRERCDLDHRSKQFMAVRSAISSMIESISDLHIELHPLRFVVSERLHGDIVRKRGLGQLSGGCQAVLALAADLAWRMAQGNPHRPNPLESEAIVLIDEVELHLHPSWQQRILGKLTSTFPNTQFIVSTHSPHILTTVQPHQIVELFQESRFISARVASDATFGAKSGDVLSTVMGVNERPCGNRFVRVLEDYTRLVGEGEGDSEEALSLRNALEEISPRDPALDRADIEIRRRRLMRKLGKTG